MFDDKNNSYSNTIPYTISINQNEYNAVRNGRGVFAWIERSKSGMFYDGDIPGVNGILHSKMAHSFEECYAEMSKNLNNSIAIKFSSFKQKISFEQIAREHPNAEIVFIPINARR